MWELDKTMYFNAKPATLEVARILRKRMTKCEELLWEKLNRKQICGLRFRRQHPIDIFIADFYCHEVRLVVELDGEIHENKKEYDLGRSAEIGKFDIKVIRFSNEQIMNSIEEVIKEIKRVVADRL